MVQTASNLVLFSLFASHCLALPVEKNQSSERRHDTFGRKEKIIERRQNSNLSYSGVPGFVEIAAPFYQTQLSRTVAGLIQSTDSNPNSSMVLGTSPTQFSQFYLTPVNVTQTSSNQSYYQPSSEPSLLLSNDSSVSDIVQLRMPMLDSLTMESQDFCATFNATPPSLMTLEPCGQTNNDTSQEFLYNVTTGELLPLYIDKSSPIGSLAAASIADSNQTSSSNSTITHILITCQPLPIDNSTSPVNASNSSLLDADILSNETSFSNSTGYSISFINSTLLDLTIIDTSNSTSSSPNSSIPIFNSTAPAMNITSSNSTDSSTNTNTTVNSGPVSMFFIPSSAYYQAPDSIASLSLNVTSISGNYSEPDASNYSPLSSNTTSTSENNSEPDDSIDNQDGLDDGDDTAADDDGDDEDS